MKKIEIFDPAMCCSTGVCGASIDPDLMRIATVINALKEKGITIQRHGLASEPQDFLQHPVIGPLLHKNGVEILPVTLLDGEVAKTKQYPTNEELCKWLGIEIKVGTAGEGSCCCCGSNGCC
jgi:hypothetical protein